jgi:hypothetical protein
MWDGMHKKCHKFLDKKDPIDKVILDLSRKGILKVGFIKIRCENKEEKGVYSRDNLSSSGKYSS